jgi:four helix bundle protein
VTLWTSTNYIEANEKLGVKDFLFRLKISRKEAKETVYWLRILHECNDFDKNINDICIELLNEANELRKILSTIINKNT